MNIQFWAPTHPHLHAAAQRGQQLQHTSKGATMSAQLTTEQVAGLFRQSPFLSRYASIVELAQITEDLEAR